MKIYIQAALEVLLECILATAALSGIFGLAMLCAKYPNVALPILLVVFLLIAFSIAVAKKVRKKRIKLRKEKYEIQASKLGFRD